jgi:adenosylcobinamide-GDP ribazoletransferase
MIGRLKSELSAFLLALQFLTRLPVPAGNAWSPERFAASVRHYPLVGVLIGSIVSAVYAVASMVFPAILAVLISTAFGALLTGAFHEDGLADTFDGIGGGGTAEESLEIMKDSRIGVFGMLALTMAISIKVSALSALSPFAVVVGLAAAHGLSRWSAVVVIATSHYVRDHGTGKPTAAGVSMPGLIYSTSVALACLALLYFLLAPGIAAGGIIGLLIGHLLIRRFFERKLGGYTGDCLGAVQQVSEIGIYLGLLACR